MSGFSEAIQESRLEAILALKLLQAVKCVISLFTHIVKRGSWKITSSKSLIRWLKAIHVPCKIFVCLHWVGAVGGRCFMTDKLYYLKKCPVPQPHPSSIGTRLLGGLDRAKALYVTKYVYSSLQPLYLKFMNQILVGAKVAVTRSWLITWK